MIKNYKFKTKPYEHQLKALEKSWAQDTYALFMEMGTGKSKVLVDNIAMLYDRGAIKGALVVAPKGVYKNWDSIEFPVHMPEHIEYTKVLWEPTLTKKKQAELDTLFADDDKLKILIMNVEAFSTSKGLDFARSFLNIFVGRALIGIDESTTIKNPTAKRTKNILTIGDLAKYRRILTGSPVTKSPLDLYSQCDFLDPNHLGHQSYYSFRARYANMVDRNFGGRRVQIVGSYRRLGELSDLLDSFSYRVLKEECLDLPEKVFTKRFVELTKEQDKAYKQMKEMALAMLDDGKLMSTVNVMTQLMRLHQITCGHFKADDGTITHLKNNRIDTLMELLDETDGKVIIWANYVEDIKNNTFPNDFKGSRLEFVLNCIAEQKQIFVGVAHPFYWKPKLRIPDIYENQTNKIAFGQFLENAINAKTEESDAIIYFENKKNYQAYITKNKE